MKLVKDLLEQLGQREIRSSLPNDTVLEALKKMSDANVGALPVLEEGRLVGIVSERDYARKVVLKGYTSSAMRVAEAMTPDPVCVTLDYSVEECMRLMTDRGFRHLPVLDNGRLISILSMKDIVSAVLSDKEALLETAIEMGKEGTQHLREMKHQTITKIANVVESKLNPIASKLDEMTILEGSNLTISKQEIDQAINQVMDTLKPIKRASEKLLSDTRVLVMSDDRQEVIQAQMALGGSGVTLDITSDPAEGKSLLKSNQIDILCINSSMIGFSEEARKLNPKIKTVFMTSENPKDYIPILKDHPQLTNIVSRAEEDRSFTIKSILTTVSKLANEDYFGMEKYLSWGAEIQSKSVASSGDRRSVIESMEEYLRGLGLRRTLIGRVSNVAEELLMNAIYDAPVDESGRPLFNHLDRKNPVNLEPHQEALLRYGCDGIYLGISVEDPFGSIKRDTVLEYLENCYSGKEAHTERDEKGGGGHGLYIIMQSSNLVVFNVQPAKRTEVIALFNLESKAVGAKRTNSFHYFAYPE